jgi:hypothetical protein
MALPSRIGLAFAAAFIVAPSIAEAIPLEYSLGGSFTLTCLTTMCGSATGGTSATEQITGSFGFDSDNQNPALGPPGCCTQNGAQFTVTGPAPYAGIYFHGFEEAIAPNEIIGDNPVSPAGFAFLFITFANDLSAAGLNPFKSVRWMTNTPFELAVDDSPTGFTVGPAAAVPEPASLGLLGIALGLLCAIRPVRRYLVSGPSPQPDPAGDPDAGACPYPIKTA